MGQLFLVTGALSHGGVTEALRAALGAERGWLGVRGLVSCGLLPLPLPKINLI